MTHRSMLGSGSDQRTPHSVSMGFLARFINAIVQSWVGIGTTIVFPLTAQTVNVVSDVTIFNPGPGRACSVSELGRIAATELPFARMLGRMEFEMPPNLAVRDGRRRIISARGAGASTRAALPVGLVNDRDEKTAVDELLSSRSSQFIPLRRCSQQSRV